MGWKRIAEVAIHALEADEVVEAGSDQGAAKAAMATELKGRLMAEYREVLESYNHSDEARVLAQQMSQLERRLRLTALRAQRLDLYSLRRRHLAGDDVVRKVLAELDISEANLGHGR
jgi:CPA1 family monovalent cation:H+ antiporter